MKHNQLFTWTITWMLLAIIPLSLSAQNNKLANHTRGEMDLAVIPIGMDKPIKVGKLAADGSLLWQWPASTPIAAADKEMFAMPVLQACGIACDNASFTDDKDAIPAGPIFIMKNGVQMGALFGASSDSLVQWINDPGYADATMGQYVEWVWMLKDMTLSDTCPQTLSYNEQEVAGSFRYQMGLKKGFNLLVKSIEKVQPTDPAIRAAFPTSLVISSPENIPENIQWSARWF